MISHQEWVLTRWNQKILHSVLWSSLHQNLQTLYNKIKACTDCLIQYGISQLLIVRSGLYLVTYLNVGNFCDKRAEKTWHEICVQGFLGFSDSNKPSQSVSLIYEWA